MRIKRKEENEDNLELYVLDTVIERTTYDTIHRYAIDKETFNQYFPNWNVKSNSKPKLQAKRKRHD